MLFIVAGALGYFSALFPFSESAPVTDTVVASSIGILVGIGLFVVRRTVSDRVIILSTVVGILMLSFLISNATTQLGTAVAAMPFIWFCVYFGAYFEPLTARIQVAVLCGCFGVALLVSDLEVSISLWVIYSVTIIVTTEALLATSHALRMQARLDPLTGLLNRRGLEEAAVPVLAIGRRIGKPTSLTMVDLDDFKKINDSKGHAAGDLALQELGASWLKEQRRADLVSRIGGDEFVIVLPATSLEEAEKLIERYRRANGLRWTCGIVEIRDGESLPAAIDRADRVLYDAKDARGGE